MSGEGPGGGTATAGERAADPDWRPFFGYEEPYANQADAIETAIDVGQKGGYLVMEGACGTGKTMAALTAATYLLRHSDRYDNAVVATPVKQQRRQFIADLRELNAGLDDPFDGIALVGKADLCPYERADAFDDERVQDACERLRENTAGLVAHEEATGDEVWWSSSKAAELVESARIDADSWRTLDDGLSTAGLDAPYPTARPTAPESLTGNDYEPPFCPFEADWYARDKSVPVDFSDGENHVVTTEELLAGSVAEGTCPHRSMGTLLDDADVVIGNYNHLFDPQTRALTDGTIDERTVVIVDEAHRLEGRVRDLLSDRVGIASLRRAQNDVARLLDHARRSRENREEIATQLEAYEVSTDALENVREFYATVIDWLDGRVESHLSTEFGDLDRAVAREERELPEEVEIPLRTPDRAESDALTEWAREEGYGNALWKSLHTVGAAVEEVLQTVEPDRSPVCGAVGRIMTRWWTRDHETYFREVTLDRTSREAATFAWERHYTAGLVCYNCLPAEELRERFSNLGGGVLMSATLEPMDVFRECVGLDRLLDDVERDESDGDDTDRDEAGRDAEADKRPVIERTYDLAYPEENRASWVVDAPAFTARNRGPPDPANENEVRETYAYALREIARSPGNVLLCLPSYREAAWAGARLDAALEKPVLVDEPSSEETTEALKRDFFAGGGKVLVTSTRGTLTEGVDYEGERLGACAVVGVPLVNVASPRIRAVRQAYGAAFSESKAFEYALTVPAVRRARQAIGRVIRGPEEVGVRVLLDGRYTPDAPRSVYEYLPTDERAEFVTMTPMFIDSQLSAFWSRHRPSR